MFEGFQGSPQLAPHDAERRQTPEHCEILRRVAEKHIALEVTSPFVEP